MIIENKITAVLKEGLQPKVLELTNESFMHNVPEGSESHFKAVIVSAAFEGKRMVQRHQMVYQTMGTLMKEIHALALHTYTAEEWAEKSDAPDSPKCHGGS